LVRRQDAAVGASQVVEADVEALEAHVDLVDAFVQQQQMHQRMPAQI
jgi:hypothetical protein